jgi:hypothetical protein
VNFPDTFFLSGRLPGAAQPFFLKTRSPHDPEIVEFFRGRTVPDHDILDLYNRIIPGMGQTDKIGKGGRRTLGHHLHGAVRKVPNDPVHTGCMGTVRNEVPVSDSLDPALCDGGDLFHAHFSDLGRFIDWEIDPGIIPKSLQRTFSYTLPVCYQARGKG